MPRLFFSSTVYPPFIEEDEAILRRLFTIETVIASGPRALLKIPPAVFRSDITLSWFGSVYAGYTVFFARLFGRKSIVIVAGVDAAADREINYGIWLTPWKSRFVRYAYRHADRVLPVDPFLQRAVIRLAEYDGRNIQTVPFGFDSSRWYPSGDKEQCIITVAACESRLRMKKKGIDKLINAASRLSEVKFQVIGIREPLLSKIRGELPPNLEAVAFVPRNELLSYLQRAKVYCQPSYTEGLPNALCEAMLCGCIPVGTIVGGIPTAIGGTGYLVPYNDQDALVEALSNALDDSPRKGDDARNRIMAEFTVQKRERELGRIVEELSKSLVRG